MSKRPPLLSHSDIYGDSGPAFANVDSDVHIVDFLVSRYEAARAKDADERDQLRKFIDALIQDVCWGRGLPDDMDGGSVQDMAEQMGVLVKVPHPLPCDHIEACGCEGEEVDYLYNTPWSIKP
jgi:hypothetical protein